jgi:hypothetical protein
VLCAEEARQFLESAKRDQDPLYAAYVLILVMGLRKGEVIGLPWTFTSTEVVYGVADPGVTGLP